MNKRLNISSDTKWEEIVGYSRAVRIGNSIEVAGTTAVDENGQVVGPSDAAKQTEFILLKIEKALLSAGATFKDVIKTRMFVTNIADWKLSEKYTAPFLKRSNLRQPWWKLSH